MNTSNWEDALRGNTPKTPVKPVIKPVTPPAPVAPIVAPVSLEKPVTDDCSSFMTSIPSWGEVPKVDLETIEINEPVTFSLDDIADATSQAMAIEAPSNDPLVSLLSIQMIGIIKSLEQASDEQRQEYKAFCLSCAEGDDTYEQNWIGASLLA